MFNITISCISFSSFEKQIKVSPSNTIQNVKNKIKLETDIDIDKQVLYFGDQLLENERTLSDYKIEQNDLIRLVLMNPGGFEIYVKHQDKSTAIQVQSSYTIEKVKEKYNEKKGIPVCEQRYIYNGKELENRRLLSDYCIERSATIHLVFRLFGGAALP
ncbi:unnamed protein product [Rhizophagus irregularis]|uniref:Ubiquitin-like protein n=1 Tax=Rhizophagus irregularis TaxID=588596 RepID=A0A2I1G701_9GLOM|nr:ubiquitin-like protein [Rhizophagus irregularis]CAB4431978.1 unnamed protein product [Rhizophagus irregularis]